MIEKIKLLEIETQAAIVSHIQEVSEAQPTNQGSECDILIPQFDQLFSLMSLEL